MISQLIPDIGSKGKYSFKDPVNTKVPENVVFTCQSIRTLADLINTKQDVFKTIYLPLGLTRENYEEDINNGVSIIGLHAEIGAVHYVPSSYLNSYPNLNGVIYTKLMMGVDLGAVPDSLSLEAIEVSISNIVYDQLGIRPEIKVIATSQSIVVNYDDHEKIEEIRKAKISVDKSDYRLLIEALSGKLAAEKRVQELENFIKQNRSKFL